MTFLSPALLWALPFALAPVIIYYLMRYRSLKVTWGADYVLTRALARLKKRVLPVQVILLMLRTLAALLLVIAFARPAGTARAPVVSGTGVHRILVIDATYSMTAGEPGRTRWERGRQALRSLVSSWGRGERWSLCVLGKSPRWLVENEALASSETALSALDGIQPEEAAAPLLAALEQVKTRIRGAATEVYIFCDDQAAAWKGADSFTWTPAPSPPVYWLCPPLPDRTNLAVTRVRFGSDKVLAGHPMRLYATVRSFSAQVVRDAPVEVRLDGAPSGRENLTLQPWQERTVVFTAAFAEPGPHHASVDLGPDALAFDNTMAAGVEVAPRLAVAVLRDAAKTGKFDSAWEFLQIVGRLGRPSAEGEPPILPGAPLSFTVHDDTPAPADLSATDVIIVDGARTLGPELVSTLREYVVSGGALLLLADERVSVDAWNRLLGEARLLPAKLGAGVVKPLAGGEFQTFSRSDLPVSTWRGFESADEVDISRAVLYAWHGLGEPIEGASILASFADGKPFLIRKSFGPGAVLLAAAGLSGSGSNLPVREFYVPMVLAMLQDAVGGACFPRTVGIAEPIRCTVPGASAAAITFQGGDAPPVPAQVSNLRGRVVAEVPGGWDRTGLCSFLVVSSGAARRIWFGVQGPRSDSDLTPLEPAARQALAARLGMREVADWPALDEALRVGRSGSEWHVWVVLGLLAALFGEMVLQRWFI